MSTYITDKTDLAENLKTIRGGFGLTQDEIAGILNLDRTCLSYYENGKTEPSIFTLIQLAEHFEIPLESFYTKDGGLKQLKEMNKLKEMQEQQMRFGDGQF